MELDGRSPLLLIDVPATPGAVGQGIALLYGHAQQVTAAVARILDAHAARS